MKYILIFCCLFFVGCVTSNNYDKDKLLNTNFQSLDTRQVFIKKKEDKKEEKKEGKKENTLALPDVKVSIYARNISLKDAILNIAKQVGVNVVFDEDVEDSQIYLSLSNIPFSQALHAILTSHDLYLRVYPNYVRISRMCTRFFNIDYVISVREGRSNTNISLSSSSEGRVSTSGLKQSSSSGNISITSSEVINFWKNFEKNLKEILKDPLYNVLQSEYNRKVLKQQIDLIPYQTQYQEEIQKQQLKMLSIREEILKKQLAEGYIPNFSALSTTQTTSTTSTTTATTGGTSETTNQLIGTYTINPQTGTVVVTTTPVPLARNGFILAISAFWGIF